MDLSVAVLRSQQKQAAIRPPEAETDNTSEDKAKDGQEHPVLSHLSSVSTVHNSRQHSTYPEDQSRILAMPAVAHMVGEETPGVAVVLVLHQDANATRLAGRLAHVLLPNHRQEQRTSRVHDGDVRKHPAPVVRLKGLDHTKEERVLGNCTHSVVGDTRRSGATNPGGISQ